MNEQVNESAPKAVAVVDGEVRTTQLLQGGTVIETRIQTEADKGGVDEAPQGEAPRQD